MSVQALNRKEAIASGEDIAPVTREEYYLKGLAEGQGGGLDYVIPEQTVTLAGELIPAEITESGLDSVGVDNDESIIVKIIIGVNVMYAALKGGNGSFEGGSANASMSIYKESEKWYMEMGGIGSSPVTLTISGIRGF